MANWCDIYVDGETDQETALAVDILREIGYQRVSELRGRVAAWKAVDFPVESPPVNNLQNIVES